MPQELSLLANLLRDPYKATPPKRAEAIKAQWLADKLIGNNGNLLMQAPSVGDAAQQINSFLPVTGDIQSGLLAASDVSKGDYKSAALNAVGLLPFLPAMAGTIGKKTQYELAHELAQKNAVEMLGLPPNNTAMDRAKALGFDTENILYHGSGTPNIEKFDLKIAKDEDGRKLGLGLGKGKIYTSSNENAASNYAEDSIRRKLGNSPTVYPLVSSGKFIPENQYDAMFESLSGGVPRYSRELNKSVRDKLIANVDKSIKKDGYSGIEEFNHIGNGNYVRGQVAVTDPTKLRSKFAAFDPARANEADLLGMATPEMLGLLAAGSAGGIAYAKNNKDKKKPK